MMESQNATNGRIVTNLKKTISCNENKGNKSGTLPESTRIQEKDSGYAWVILIACVGLRMLVGGPDGMMGVLLLELSHRFQASEVLLNVTVSMQFAVSLLASRYFYTSTFLLFFISSLLQTFLDELLNNNII